LYHLRTNVNNQTINGGCLTSNWNCRKWGLQGENIWTGLADNQTCIYLGAFIWSYVFKLPPV